MNDWFEWNGVRCTEYGIYVTEQPPPTIPEERVTFTKVPGRSGSLTTLEGEFVYEDMVLTAACVIADPDKIPEIAGWLRGSGTVTFANRDGGFYYARVINQIPFEKILRGNPHRSFVVNFRCKPFWYADGTSKATLTASGGAVNNPGDIYSKPVITVRGSGDITLMIGQNIVELSDVTEGIVIDSALQEAYWGTELRNHCMSGDFPKLYPGVNPISWSGNVTGIEIEPNWRYL